MIESLNNMQYLPKQDCIYSGASLYSSTFMDAVEICDNDRYHRDIDGDGELIGISIFQVQDTTLPTFSKPDTLSLLYDVWSMAGNPVLIVRPDWINDTNHGSTEKGISE